ncbi:decarboxylating NADP(+)-dependent phosphogluconate dehydrogenase [Candidatus Sumerlaeota bacterium]|nr:decarboxylating NADP(+)-dependent phosphogluconate dehydrogenase [Candidatus Sumerlaeota bacterium]
MTPRDDPHPPNVGLMGLGVMGRNLALNIADHGFPTVVWNRTASKTRQFAEQNPHPNLSVKEGLSDFVSGMSRPRRIILMIDAGQPVDEALRNLVPLLTSDDVVIDGGNSWFEDTGRRAKQLEPSGLLYLGMGVSGGEQGARFGPSLMPGGDPLAYERMQDILDAISAKTDSGACVTYIGPGGAGHFVKMVHNGIEYADMQLIAEAYDLLRKAFRLDSNHLAEIFQSWNSSDLESFLIEITSKVLRKKDERTGGNLVDMTLDKAGQKGTGGWTLRAALALGVPIPSISAAVDARLLSNLKDERSKASGLMESVPQTPIAYGQPDFIFDLQAALFASKICSYAQGLALIRAASLHYNWKINLKEVARIWKGGCIIRARILDSIMYAFDENAALSNLLIHPYFSQRIAKNQHSWRRIVAFAVSRGIPIPCMSASLAYHDGYRSASLPQNLTQAQRDAFGAHTYQRADDPNGPFMHTNWMETREP